MISYRESQLKEFLEPKIGDIWEGPNSFIFIGGNIDQLVIQEKLKYIPSSKLVFVNNGPVSIEKCKELLLGYRKIKLKQNKINLNDKVFYDDKKWNVYEIFFDIKYGWMYRIENGNYHKTVFESDLKP
jgi:hypothetical protein